MPATAIVVTPPMISNLTLTLTKDIANAEVDVTYRINWSAFDQLTNLSYTEAWSLVGLDGAVKTTLYTGPILAQRGQLQRQRLDRPHEVGDDPVGGPRRGPQCRRRDRRRRDAHAQAADRQDRAERDGRRQLAVAGVHAVGLNGRVESADAVVIGAGVIGSAVALELARAGRSVVGVDKGPAPGAGSTSASSSIIRFSYSTRDSVLTAWESAAIWRNWPEHLGVEDPDGMARFIRTGYLGFNAPGYDSATVLALWDELGIPYELLDADELAPSLARARRRRLLPAQADRRPGLRRRRGERAHRVLRGRERVHRRPDARRPQPRPRGPAPRRRVPLPGGGGRDHPGRGPGGRRGVGVRRRRSPRRSSSTSAGRTRR